MSSDSHKSSSPSDLHPPAPPPSLVSSVEEHANTLGASAAPLKSVPVPPSDTHLKSSSHDKESTVNATTTQPTVHAPERTDTTVTERPQASRPNAGGPSLLTLQIQKMRQEGSGHAASDSAPPSPIHTSSSTAVPSPTPAPVHQRTSGQSPPSPPSPTPSELGIWPEKEPNKR